MFEPWRVSTVGFDSHIPKLQKRIPILNEAQSRAILQEAAKSLKRAITATKSRRTRIRKMQKYTLTLEELVLFHQKCCDRTLYRREEGEELALAVLDDWIINKRMKGGEP